MDELLRGAAERLLRPPPESAPAGAPVAEPAAVTEPAAVPVPPAVTGLPDKPVPDEELLDLLSGLSAPPDPAVPATVAARWLVPPEHPVPDAVTRPVVPWLVDLLGLPTGTAGGLVADAATATATALAAARYRILAEVGWDVDSQGLSAAPPITVVVGDEAHPRLHDALRLLGLGQDRVIRIRTDGQGRIRPTLIPPLHRPALVCTQVGETAGGAIDPVAAVCAEVHDADAWVHVDGTFGLWAAASPMTRDLLVGVPYADSWATVAPDGSGPDGSGLVAARDGAALRVALELARPARPVEVWAALLALGRAGVAERVEVTCGQARRLAGELVAAGYPVLNEVVLDRVVVGGNTTGTVGRLRGVVDVSGTVWQRRPAICIRVGTRPVVDAVIHALTRSSTR